MLNDWLNTVCGMLTGAHNAGLFSVSNGQLELDHCWPETGDCASVLQFKKQAELALAGQNAVISYEVEAPGSPCIIAQMFKAKKGKQYVLLVCFSSADVNPKYQLSLINWGIAWFRVLDRQASIEQRLILSEPVISDDAPVGPASTESYFQRTVNLIKSYPKSSVVSLITLVLCLWLPVDHSIKSPVVVEGRVQRSVTVPVDGFLKSINVKAGDRVSQGQLLATLDESEFRLQLEQVSNDLKVADKQHRLALSQLNYSEAQQFALQRDIAEIDIRLLEQQLSRLELKAPISGQIISGDMGRASGTAVERGQALFEMAPVGDYRVVFNVDETDIRYVAKGQKGEILLSGLGNTSFPVEIDRVSSIFTPDQGQRYYRCEGRLLGVIDNNLRPGMAGTADVIVGSKSLGIVLFEPLLQWLRLKAWQILP
ncbi:efflux RND transporter periplasmic adaptor subunit [Amphritea balenae]|uniref:efflux RND transporter periplasmic adaptor subunit n=1 Tax=Amphritea balenae TaxID=452629 RepID=UPI001669A1AC|nr:HlyD family efflux transporter periplasmic adaptor subunit [Amphritea balenae]